MSNIKDTKNPDLRLNFLTGSIGVSRMAKMTAEVRKKFFFKKRYVFFDSFYVFLQIIFSF